MSDIVVPKLKLHLLPSDRMGTVWHRELERGKARLGEVTVGPSAFVMRLAGLFGVPAWVEPEGQRVAALHAALQDSVAEDDWHAETLAQDPYGAAQFILAARDRLRALGWNGEALNSTPRLRALSASEGVREVKRGSIDLSHALLHAVQTRKSAARIGVRLGAARRAYPEMISRILDALEAAGVEVEASPEGQASADASSDLGKLQRAILNGTQVENLNGDGSIEWLQAPTPREAAELATARCDDDAVWTVTSAAFELEDVRARTDRPRLGVREESPFRPALQVLPLALSLQFAPRDPALAVELLANRPSPFPGLVKRHLLERLGNSPGVGGDEWDRVLEKGIEAHAARYEGVNVDALRARAALLFPREAKVEVEGVQLAAVVNAVASWARGRGSTGDDPGLMAAAAVAGRLAEMLAALGPDESFDRNRALQLHDIALGAGTAHGQPAEVGAPSLAGDPAAVRVPISKLVWFGAVAGAAELGSDVDWTAVELAEMAGSGLGVESLPSRRVVEQEGWRGALIAARERVTLVSWQFDGTDPVSEHPVFDLVEAAIGGDALASLRTGLAEHFADEAGSEVLASDARERVSIWKVDATAAVERRWSASALETFVDCPARWVFHYAANLRPGAADTIAGLRNVAGTFAHSLFEDVLFAETPGWDGSTPEVAAQQLRERFLGRVENDCAPLTLPRNLGYQAQLLAQLERAMSTLVKMLKDDDWRPVEHELSLADRGGSFGGQPLTGSVDLVVARPDGREGVIDFKLGGAKYKRPALREGKALQLAIYSEGIRPAGGDHPPVGYFILNEATMLTTNGESFPSGEEVSGDGPGKTMQGIEAAWSDRKDAIAGKTVQARAQELEPSESDALVEKAMNRPPKDHPWRNSPANCTFCEQKRLCQFGFAGGGA